MGVLDTARSKGIHRPHVRDKSEKINKVAGVVGHDRKKGWSAEHAKTHQSAPLSTLRDPDSFGAPPRHRAAQAVESPTATPSQSSALTTTSGSYATRPAQPAKPSYASRGLGAPLPQSAVHAYKAEKGEVEEEEAKPAPPPVPYRVNTTGLNTENLPKPPVRRPDPGEVSEPPRTTVAPKPSSRATPQPPPRLTTRQNSHPDEYTPPAPPPYVEPTQPESRQPAGLTSPGQLSELQTRFAKMPGRVSSPPAQPSATSPPTVQTGGQGTTWSQKQAALRTVAQGSRDPSSVSATDAYSAAHTAQDFHQRHGEQVASGVETAKGLDSRYGIRGKVGSFAPGQSQGSEPQPAPPTAATTLAAHKKAPPPPPPPKKPQLQAGSSGTGNQPPPIPLSSKPS